LTATDGQPIADLIKNHYGAASLIIKALARTGLTRQRMVITAPSATRPAGAAAIEGDSDFRAPDRVTAFMIVETKPDGYSREK
jgi:hypothetical protein